MDAAGYSDASMGACLMQPLEGLLVISIEQAVAAPLCSSRLAAAGARVIKIEREEGDFARGYDAAASGDSSYFTWLNQGKESLCLDFKDADGAALLWRMLAKADMVIQNLAPGALARAGFSTAAMQAVNPRLIICNITGYGMQGSAHTKRAYDLLVQAESGLISVSGSPDAPGRIGVSVCDIGAGMAAYSGVLEALLRRGISGIGDEIGISLFDVAAEWMAVPYIHAEFGDGPPAPVGLQHPSIAPYGAFACSDDRLVLISIQNEREWQRLCADVLDAPAMATRPEYISNNDRVANRPALEAEISAITRTMTADVFQARLTQAEIAFGAINGPADLRNHPAFRTQMVGNSAGVEMAFPAYPVAVTGAADAVVRRTPRIGEHTALITAEFAAGEA